MSSCVAERVPPEPSILILGTVLVDASTEKLLQFAIKDAPLSIGQSLLHR